MKKDGTTQPMFVFSAGLVPQSFHKFLVVSTLARVPAIIACSFGGHALSSGDYSQAVIIFAVTGILSVTGILLYKYFTNKKQK